MRDVLGRFGRRPARSPPPSTTAGCRGGPTTAATGRRRAPTRPARRTATAPTTPGRRRARPARRSTRRTRRPPANPTPHTGLRCCCVSSTQPDGVHLAVEVHGELRARGRSARATSTSADGAVGGDQPPGDAEVAVEPRVVEDAAVHLDGELLPPERTGVGMRLHPQARRVGVATDDAERQGGVGRIRRAAATRSARRRGRRSRRPARRSSASASSSRSKPVSRSIVDSTACHGDGERVEEGDQIAERTESCGGAWSVGVMSISPSGTGPWGGRCHAGGWSR